MAKHTPVLLAAISALAACSEDKLIDDNTSSRFVQPLPNGAITSITGPSLGFVDGTGSGYVFKAGNELNGEKIIAVAGILPTTTVLAPPTSGSINYSGDYQMVYVSDFDINDDILTGQVEASSGSLELTADFGNGSLTGAADDLSIDGQISGNQLSGSVSYAGVDGDLDGLIGSDKAVGAFHGNDSDEIYAGGFYVLPVE